MRSGRPRGRGGEEGRWGGDQGTGGDRDKWLWVALEYFVFSISVCFLLP